MISNRITEDDLTHYERDIRDLHHTLLTADEEHELAQRIEAGDEAARARLIECNLRLVFATAVGYAAMGHMYGLSLADLVQEGNIGLMRAVEKFDYRKGNRFSTYATYWIRQAIGRAIDESGLIRVPVHVREAARQQARGRTLPPRQERAVEVARRLDARRRLDQPMSEDADSDWSEVLADPSAEAAFDDVAEREERAQRQAYLRALMETTGLSEREQAWVLRWAGGESYSDIARADGYSREWVRQVARGALAKLRSVATAVQVAA